MPLYEYQCPTCGRFELIRKFSDEPVTLCPTCGAEVQKLFSSPAIQFKGTGWYVTDYAGKSKDGKSESKGKDKDGKGESKDSGKSESKDSGASKDSGSSAKSDSSSSSSSSDNGSSGSAAASSTPSTTTK